MDDSPTRRTARILGVGARTLGRTILKRMPGGDRAQKRIDYWTDVGKDLSETLEDLRGAAMKFGQLASQYADVLPPELAEQLRKLQRSVEPLDFDKIKPVIDANWTEDQSAQIEALEPTAIAAASIGQVHRARLKESGENVVVKVRYPGVERAVDADLTQLRRLISMSKLLPLDKAAMDSLMTEVRQRFREETDYGAELSHLKYLRERANLPGIIYPSPCPELSGAGILVLSEEWGEPLEIARTWSQSRRDQIGTTLSQWLAHQFFEAHSIHADPHPGNFAFRENGDVVVYDFGCVKRVPPDVVAHVRRLLRAAAHKDWNGVHTTLQALGGLGKGADSDRLLTFYQEVHGLIGLPLSADAAFDFSNPKFLNRIRRHAREHIGLTFQFKPIPDLVFVMRALSGHYWLLRALGARVDVNAVLAAYEVRLRSSEPD